MSCVHGIRRRGSSTTPFTAGGAVLIPLAAAAAFAAMVASRSSAWDSAVRSVNAFLHVCEKLKKPLQVVYFCTSAVL